jgi:chromosomal replication initiation ATPase DnaA
LWSPGEELLIALARKLMDDRQLSVPEAVIERIVHSLERSPAAIRAFIAKADAKALAEARPITLGLVRELIAEEDVGLS